LPPVTPRTIWFTLLGLAVLGLVILWLRPTPAPLPAAGQAAIQITWTGKVDQIGPDGLLPDLTIFSDGRVLLVEQAEDGSLHLKEGRMAPERVALWLGKIIRQLGRGSASQHEEGCIDCPTRQIAWWTPEGVRRSIATGSVPVARRITALHEGMRNEVAATLSPYIPDQITLLAAPIEMDFENRDWPADLVPLPTDLLPDKPYAATEVTGEPAMAIARRIPHRPRSIYVQASQRFVVRWKPAIPILR
jgi:hypothetical protein